MGVRQPPPSHWLLVNIYHPTPLDAVVPQDWTILIHRDVWYFISYDNDSDYDVNTFFVVAQLGVNIASWYTPPHYAIVFIGHTFVVSRHP